MNSDSNHFCNFVLLRVSQKHLFCVCVKHEDFIRDTEAEKRTRGPLWVLTVSFSFYIARSACATFLEVNKTDNVRKYNNETH